MTTTTSAARAVPDSASLDEALAGIAGRAARHDREGSFPHEAFEALHRAGVLALTAPTEYGGRAAGLAESVELVRAVGAADPSVALVLAMNLIQHAALREPGCPWPPGIRRDVQRSARGGPALINALRVEPALGSPARGGLPETVAERIPGGWSLSGHKTYATGIPGLRWLLVWARTDEPSPRVGSFLVPAGTPGYRVSETWDHLGMRATRSDDVILDGVIIPDEYAVDVAPRSHPAGPPPAFAAWNALLIGAVYDGVARAARDWLARYLNERVPASLGRPLASLPRFQEAMGRIEALLFAGGSLLDATARAVDAGAPSPAGAPAEAALAKSVATGNAIKVVELGLSLIGNPGLSRRNPLERHYRDVLCARIHTPQDDSVLTAAGAAALRPYGSLES